MSTGEPLRVLDLFSGIGGFSIGLERAGMRTVAFCEIEPFCQAVLAKHWPGIPVFNDVTKLRSQEVGAIDVICGGFPCQDISYAGKGLGLEGARSGLWFEFARIIEETQPVFAVIENVSAIRNRGLDQVLWSLAKIGYDAEWHCIPASAIGAPHDRDRTWIIAYRNGTRRARLVESLDIGQVGSWGWRGKEDLQLIAESPYDGSDRWPQPLICRMDDGIPARLDRIKSCGNAVVPAITEIIGKAIIASLGE